MAKVLSQLPPEIWYHVLFHWLGDLRQIARTDCAFCFTSFENPLRAVCADQAARFPDIALDTDKEVLTELCLWLYSRKLGISHLNFVNNKLPPPARWKDLFSMSAETLQSLSVGQPCLGVTQLISWASRYLRRLQVLKIERWYQPVTQAVGQLLRNNASSLVYLQLETAAITDEDEEFYNPVHENINLPNLKVLRYSHWEEQNFVSILRGCPNLTSLRILDVNNYHNNVVSVMGELKHLRRLHFSCVEHLDGDSLLLIARGCPLLEYIAFEEPLEVEAEQMADFVCSLTHLKTLVVSFNQPEAVLLEIAVRGHPSLRIVDCWTAYTFAGLRQLTATMPQLTGLFVSISGDVEDDEPNAIDALEYCGGLTVLKVNLHRFDGDSLRLVLNSAIKHCPNLHTLILCGTQAYHVDIIDSMLVHLPQLRTFRVDKCLTGELSGNVELPNLKIVNDGDHPEIEPWVLDWPE